MGRCDRDFPRLPQGGRERLWKACGLCGSRGEGAWVERVAESGSCTAGEEKVEARITEREDRKEAVRARGFETRDVQ